MKSTKKNQKSNDLKYRLTLLLSDETILYTKTRNYHWNVEGLLFNDLHKFFESQYTNLEVIIDDVAERIRQLKSFAIGTLEEFLSHSRLKEKANHYPEAKIMIKEILKDHESIIESLKEDIKIAQHFNDEATANFLTDLLENHEKMAWMLRSYLQ
jgi:starvation-inducible DNA-binding protein